MAKTFTSLPRLSQTLKALEDAGRLEVVHVADHVATRNGASKAMLIKALAGFNSSKFVSVMWTKDDGEQRSAVVNPLDFTGVKGDSAAPSAQQAVATRKATNPDLWNVIDHSIKGRKRAKASGRPAWISIRCRGKITLKQGATVANINLG